MGGGWWHGEGAWVGLRRLCGGGCGGDGGGWDGGGFVGVGGGFDRV